MKRKLIIREKIMLAICLSSLIIITIGTSAGYFFGVDLLKNATIGNYQGAAKSQVATASGGEEIVVLYNVLIRKMSVQIMLLLADAAYSAADPRIRTEKVDER